MLEREMRGWIFNLRKLAILRGALFNRTAPLLQVSRRMHAALETSVSRHFAGNHCINCMCHSTENIYRFTDTAVARASDDFYPRDPASSTPHIAACAFNSLFLGALVQPDWDMFHSKHSAGEGCPVSGLGLG